MGNCNCLVKPQPGDSPFKSEITVEGMEVSNNKALVSDVLNNNSMEKKNSARGVSNPTQNNMKKNIKNENSKSSNKNNQNGEEPDKTDVSPNNVKKKETLLEKDQNPQKDNAKQDNNNNINNIFKDENNESNEKFLNNNDNNNSINANAVVKQQTNMSIKNPKINKKLTDLIKLKDLKKINKDKKTINVVLVGDRCVGKTSIIFQYTSSKFDQFYITTIFKEDFRKPISIGNKQYNFYFTVTSGDSQYQGDYTNIYKTADFFVLVYDVTNSASFEKMKEIVNKEILQYICLYKEDYSNILVAANKCDLKNKRITKEEVDEFCNKYCFDYFEISAKNNLNIGRLFSKIAEIYDEIVSS